jgi:galactokinase
VASTDFPGDVVTVAAGQLRPELVHGWPAYVAGVVWALRERGIDIGGADVFVDGDVSHGAGLSSSAALECAVACALDDAAGLGLSRTDLVAVARSAENGFVGVPSGSLDQSASLLCRPGHALLLDTRTMARRHVPLDLPAAGLRLLVIDTRAPHRLVDGEYAARRSDCEAAARLLGVPALRDVSDQDLEDALSTLTSGRLRRRVRHVVTENARVLEVVTILSGTAPSWSADPRAIGPALTASHVSLRDDYEVSCRELDLAVDSALAAGAYGARMTGGGFGGSAIALVDGDQAHDAAAAVTAAFAAAQLTEPNIFAVTPSPGAHRMS